MRDTLPASAHGSRIEPGAHVVLVGLPGVGKTTVGRGVAERLGCRFIDFDQEIERREGKSVVEIFAERGEAHFRALERALTMELRDADPMIVAPGGGWIENPAVVEILRPPSSLVYLRAEPATVLARLGSAVDTRPLLLGPDPLAAVERLYERRRRSYESAEHVLNTEMLGIEKLMDAVAELVTFGGGGVR
jgi:shikimate kinase